MTVALAVQGLSGLLDPGAWSPVTAPGTFDNANISNLNGASILRVRTDPNDSSTELVVAAGAEQMISGTFNRSERAARFTLGQVPFYIKPDSGTGSGQKVLWS